MSYGNTILAAAAFGFLLAIYCMAGEMDYQDAKAEESEYCWRVAQGAHRHWNTNIDCPAMPRQVAGVEHE